MSGCQGLKKGGGWEGSGCDYNRATRRGHLGDVLSWLHHVNILVVMMYNSFPGCYHLGKTGREHMESLHNIPWE